MEDWSLAGFGESNWFQRILHIFWQGQLTFQLKQIKKNQEYEDHIFDEDDDDSNGHSY